MTPEEQTRADKALRSSADLVRKSGISVIPFEESLAHLALLGGNPFEMIDALAVYDTSDDAIVFNVARREWADMPAYMKQRGGAQGYFSSDHRLHVARHEIGHAFHYRQLSSGERAALWLRPLTPEQESVTRQVSLYARDGIEEFVAEVFAGQWAKKSYSPEVMALYNQFRGPTR